MAKIARKSDGRRIFTDEFKREQIGRVLRGDLTLAELSRKLGIARSLLQRWKRGMAQRNGIDGIGSVGNGHRNRTTELRADQYIRDLQLLLGRQTVELELLREELDGLKKGRIRK
jgi:transposase-like protein